MADDGEIGGDSENKWKGENGRGKGEREKRTRARARRVHLPGTGGPYARELVRPVRVATNHCVHPAARASRMVALNYFAVCDCGDGATPHWKKKWRKRRPG